MEEFNCIQSEVESDTYMMKLAQVEGDASDDKEFEYEPYAYVR